MKVVIHVNHSEHQRTHGEAMRRGLRRHGMSVSFAPRDVPVACDFAVIWGWKQDRVIRSMSGNGHVLVMERGYFPDRMVYCSLGWDGLNNRARFPECADGGERWRRCFARYLVEWRRKTEDKVYSDSVRLTAAPSERG